MFARRARKTEEHPDQQQKKRRKEGKTVVKKSLGRRKSSFQKSVILGRWSRHSRLQGQKDQIGKESGSPRSKKKMRTGEGADQAGRPEAQGLRACGSPKARRNVARTGGERLQKRESD